ncbi:HAD hydrolase-like protein [Sphingomonas sp. BK235]|uniref:HAD hydrolase-like protein n=1 Tax=Sphingomonas sp. BK235 TaxID=2512131 RepID=UPI0010449E32|nr:HAD hydrolase-like protein [Sphingomonas sp. BK235]TCP36054.1 phosphoglycolate phosphatase [Sphingomonas sp. BK235]
MRYDLVIFDFDGTIADSREWFFGSLNGVADRFGFRRTTVDERERLRDLGTREILRELRIPLWKMPSIARYMRELAATQIETIRLFDGIPDALRRLWASGTALAIVSSNDEHNVREVLGSDLAAAFGFYGCGSSLFGKKAKLRQAIRRFGVEPGRTVCVGDETRDIEAARAVGGVAAAVAWGYATPEALRRHHPDVLLSRVEDIAGLF